MTPAAFRASYSDWKVIKGRKVVQIVFEMPLETSDEAYQALGGMPIAAREVWCGIARLSSASSSAEEAPRPALSPPAPPAGDERHKRSFEDMAPSQQAGMLSQDRAFRLFLAEKFDMPIPDPDEAADIIRHHCKVKSRADIRSDNPDWSALVLAYRLWVRHPELSDAS